MNDASTIISLLALLIAALGLLLNSRKDTRSSAADNARIEAKLDNVNNGVQDIRVDLRGLQNKVLEHGERLTKVEARAASNTKRLDALDAREN